MSILEDCVEVIKSHWGESFPDTEYRECCACLRLWPCAAYRLASAVLDSRAKTD